MRTAYKAAARAAIVAADTAMRSVCRDFIPTNRAQLEAQLVAPRREPYALRYLIQGIESITDGWQYQISALRTLLPIVNAKPYEVVVNETLKLRLYSTVPVCIWTLSPKIVPLLVDTLIPSRDPDYGTSYATNGLKYEMHKRLLPHRRVKAAPSYTKLPSRMDQIYASQLHEFIELDKDDKTEMAFLAKAHLTILEFARAKLHAPASFLCLALCLPNQNCLTELLAHSDLMTAFFNMADEPETRELARDPSLIQHLVGYQITLPDGQQCFPHYDLLVKEGFEPELIEAQKAQLGAVANDAIPPVEE